MKGTAMVAAQRRRARPKTTPGGVGHLALDGAPRAALRRRRRLAPSSACVRLENPLENRDVGTLCLSSEQTQGLGAFFARVFVHLAREQPATRSLGRKRKRRNALFVLGCLLRRKPPFALKCRASSSSFSPASWLTPTKTRSGASLQLQTTSRRHTFFFSVNGTFFRSWKTIFRRKN